MPTFTKRALVAVTLAAGLSSLALTRQDHDGVCSLSTLHGAHMFAASGFNIVGGIAQPKAIVEVIDFNGDGTLTVTAATRSVNGVITQIPPGGTGTYTLDAGCTGTLAFAAGPGFDIFTAPGGKTIWMIQTNPNTVLQSTATRVAGS